MWHPIASMHCSKNAAVNAPRLILFVIGRGQLQQVQGAPQTVETLKEIPETLKRNEENR